MNTSHRAPPTSSPRLTSGRRLADKMCRSETDHVQHDGGDFFVGVLSRVGVLAQLSRHDKQLGECGLDRGRGVHFGRQAQDLAEVNIHPAFSVPSWQHRDRRIAAQQLRGEVKERAIRLGADFLPCGQPYREAVQPGVVCHDHVKQACTQCRHIAEVGL